MIPLEVVVYLIGIAGLIGGCLGYRLAAGRWREEICLRGFGRFHPTTRRFQWKDETRKDGWETAT